MEYINKNAELHPITEEKDFPRQWKPTSRQELYVYLAVLIHMGLHGESTIKDYWHKDFNYGLRHIIQKYISANRWQQINCYFYYTKLRSKDNKDF